MIRISAPVLLLLALAAAAASPPGPARAGEEAKKGFRFAVLGDPRPRDPEDVVTPPPEFLRAIREVNLLSGGLRDGGAQVGRPDSRIRETISGGRGRGPQPGRFEKTTRPSATTSNTPPWPSTRAAGLPNSLSSVAASLAAGPR